MRNSLKRVATPELELAEKGRNLDASSQFMNFDDLSECSMSTVEDVNSSFEEEDFLLASESIGPSVGKEDASIFKIKKRPSEFDVARYMQEREMTPLQERFNAITVVPTFIFCFYFLLSGLWMDASMVDETREQMAQSTLEMSESGCLSSHWFPHLYAMPPLPVLAAATGIIVHAPFSFIYHFFYAHRLPAGLARTTHWSRRMDQAMIHIISATMSYATSGNFDFFLVNLLFNIDCIYRQFQRKVRPKRNQIRIAISCVAYMIPFLRRGELLLFTELCAVFALSGWLFAAYPIGGWSHSVFHLVIALVPPLVMTAAMQLPASHDQMKLAAQCAILQERLASKI